MKKFRDLRPQSLNRGLIKTAILFISLTTSLSTQAITAQIVDDPAFGVGSVLRDAAHNTDFLRLDFTTNRTYTNVVAETAPGGDFSGWHVASEANMFSLSVTEGIIHNSTDANQIQAARDIRDFFCPTGTCLNPSSITELAVGRISNQNLSVTIPSGTPPQFTYGIGSTLPAHPSGVRASFDLTGWQGVSISNSSLGTYLIRTSPSPVPVPPAFWLFGTAIVSLFRLKNNNQ